MRDWQKRALKTFVQAFFGVLIPVIVATLNGIVEVTSGGQLWGILFPAICAALAAGIAAVWNVILEKLKSEQ